MLYSYCILYYTRTRTIRYRTAPARAFIHYYTVLRVTVREYNLYYYYIIEYRDITPDKAYWRGGSPRRDYNFESKLKPPRRRRSGTLLRRYDYS